MSLKSEGLSPIPEETARVAHAAYPKGNVFMRMHDELGTIYGSPALLMILGYVGLRTSC
jgi:hypothetical protein